MSINGFKRGFLVDFEGDLADSFGVVANALELPNDEERPSDGTQVDRHRLLCGDQEQRPFFELVAQIIDIPVGRDDPVGKFGISRAKRIDRTLDRFFGHVPQQQ